MEDQMRWSLREMFPADEDWNREMEQASEIAKALAGRKGHLAENAEALAETARLYLELEEKLYRLMVFANSNFDQNMADPAAKKLYETAQNQSTAIGEALSFMAPELMQYSMEDFNRYCEEKPELKEFAHFAEDFFARKEHILSDEMETLLVRMNDMGESFSKVFEDLTVNDMEFPMIQTLEGESIRANEANYAMALENPDPAFRRDYYKGLLGTYQKHINTLTSIHYGSVKNDCFTAKSRKYASARAAALFANHIPETVYDNLLETVRANVEPLHEYVAFRKERLGLDTLYFSDLFVPLVQESARKYTYEEAQKLVLDAVSVLGEDYTALIQKAFDERWIDVYPREAKRTGAYSTGAYKCKPYVLLNFTGTLDDVFTLAHELGHSLHTWFSNENQPLLYSGYSIFCAEVASTLNEQLLSRWLFEHSTSKEEKALLLCKRLDDIRSTFYRQTMFADFEYQTHKLVEAGEPLVPETLCGIHRKLNEDYYGPELTVDDYLSCEWARIPHFYSAFYVYQYATGIAASTAIAHRIFTEGAPAVADYRKFLTTGGSGHPIDLLKIAGVDMASPKPVLDTIETFRTTLQELKALLG